MEAEAEPVSNLSYEEKVSQCNAISQPMASEKLSHKIYKLIRKASKMNRTHLFVGNKAVQSKIRKGETGLIIIAGDVEPIDVMCHFPGVCEDKGIPYVYVPSKSDMGLAFCGKGQAMIALIKSHEDYAELYEKVLSGVQKCKIVL